MTAPGIIIVDDETARARSRNRRSASGTAQLQGEAFRAFDKTIIDRLHAHRFGRLARRKHQRSGP